MNSKEGSNQALPSNKYADLETPFLDEDLFVGESAPDWDVRLTALEAESPYPHAFEQISSLGAEPASDQLEMAAFDQYESERELPGELVEGEIMRTNPAYIKWVQHSLNRILGVQLSVDGIIGTKTRDAVRRFQKEQGLVSDGVVGQQTEAALIAAGAGQPPTEIKPTLPTPTQRKLTSFTLVPVEDPGGGRIKDKRDPLRADLLTVTGVRGRPIQLHRLAADALGALLSAARADGVREPLLLPTSGYRSSKRQAELFQAALAKYGSKREARKWVAPPGGSAHQSGRAIDFFLGGRNSSRNVANLRQKPAYRWLVGNAQRFGFYPYQREPWHWEYNPPMSIEEREDAFDAYTFGQDVLEIEQELALLVAEEIIESENFTLQEDGFQDSDRLVDLEEDMESYNEEETLYGEGEDVPYSDSDEAEFLAEEAVFPEEFWAEAEDEFNIETELEMDSIDGWVVPADVRRAGEAQVLKYNDALSWDAKGRNCTGRLTEGGRVLREYLLSKFPGIRKIGGYNCRPNSASPHKVSIHGTGRALDIMIPTINGQANSTIGDPIANWLVINASKIGIQFLIWNRVRWSGGRRSRKFGRYTGDNPHRDHIHVELNLEGAQRQTPWFTGRVVPAGQKKAQAPDYDKAIRQNRRYGRSLGWHQHQEGIERMLGFTDMSPDEKLFAQAIADWQRSHNLTDDGVIGPGTWAKMKAILNNMVQAAGGIDLNRAKNQNRRYGRSLGWHQHQEGLERMLGFSNLSPDEKRFAQAVADWQHANKLSIDGIIGPDTWSKMKDALDKFMSKVPLVWPTRPLPPSQYGRFIAALNRLEEQIKASNDPRMWRYECWIEKLKQTDFDDRVIEWRKICPSTSGAIGAAYVVGPCDAAVGMRPSQEEIETGIQSVADVEALGQSIGIFTYLRAQIVVSEEMTSFPLENLRRRHDDVQKAIDKLREWSSAPLGGSSAMPKAYVSIKDWIGLRQSDSNSVYSCK